ncbi:MAG: acyl-CoA desaturase [Paraperlucidibaca sp.]
MSSQTAGLPKHLSAEQVEEFGREVDAIRDEIFDSLGDRDRAYILGLIRAERVMAVGGRFIMLFSVWFLPALGLAFSGWLPLALGMGFGAILLGLAKILENMEIGHNVMHAQWDWMKDPAIQSNTWEWDNVGPSDQWIHSHNVVHHTWTNVIGKDPDVGYGLMRVTPEQRWKPKYLSQPLTNIILALFFQWGVGLNDIIWADKTNAGPKKVLFKRFLRKAYRQLRKDYFAWPLFAAVLSGLASWALNVEVLSTAMTAFGLTFIANLFASTMRNVWTNVIIFCGHFPEGVHHFRPEDVEGETRAHWYVRQLMGSCNISGGKLLNIMSGHLSFQIEHHLFPDMPSNRYPEVALRIQALTKRYGLPYNRGSLLRQYGTTTWKIWRLAFPGGEKVATS